MGKDGWGRDGGINGGVDGRRDEGIKTEMGRGGGERCTKEPGARRFRVGRCHGGKPGLVHPPRQTHLSLDGNLPSRHTGVT